MALKNQSTNCDMKKRQVLYKNPFDTFFDMTLFSYRCPEFTFSIFYRNYFNPNGTLSKNIDIPDPIILEDFLYKFADKGLLSPLFSLPCIDLRLTHGIDVWKHDSFVGDIVVCSAPLRFYVCQLIKAYAIFHKNFNFRNYIIK